MFHAAGRTLPVRLKIDCGYHRVGVAPEKAVETARRIADLPGIALAGVFTHGGQGYAGRTPEDREEVAYLAARALTAAVERKPDAIALAALAATPDRLGADPATQREVAGLLAALGKHGRSDIEHVIAWALRGHDPFGVG